MFVRARTGNRRAVSGLLGLLLLTGSLGLAVPAVARADSAPVSPSAATPATVTADGLPTVQIDGVAWSQAVVGNTVYVAGSFTSARPAGAAAGVSETPRNNLLAYDIRTGALIASFAPNLNGQALVVAASPDGSRIYVGGDFTSVDGQTRKRVAAFDTASGALITSWHPSVSSQVRAIAATNATVYLGGTITAVGATSRTKLAAVSAADGSLLPWAPVPGPGSTASNHEPGKTAAQEATLNYDVLSLVLTGNGNQVVAAGRFDTMNGSRATGVAALDPVTGANRPFAINQMITNQGINSAVYSLSTDGTNVFGTAYDFYGPGNLEGSFEVTADGGRIIALNTCHGDTYSSYPSAGVLYISSHEHDCSSINGFPEQNPRVNRFATAMTIASTQTLGSGSGAWSGQPGVSQLAWFPSLTPGSYTGQHQASWNVSGNGSYVVYGGEFTAINGVNQQGLVRFAVPSIAPNKVGPIPAPGLTPTVTAPVAGLARVTWTATSDPDNENLTYRVFRDGAGTPVYTRTQSSLWWRTPAMSFADAGVSSGTHSYKITVTDPWGNKIGGTAATSVTVPNGTYTPRAYADAIRADGAQDYWPLGESSGPTGYDWAGTSDLAVNSGVTTGRTGALTGDANTAYGFNGSSGLAATRTASAAPTTFTEEAWFQTTSRQGGKIMGFGSSSSGLSGSYDRHVYMDTSGRVLFGVYPGTVQTVQSATGFNDGKWHHVVASLSSAGMQLYLDGVLVSSRTDVTTAQSYSGYFRIGGDNTWSGARYFTGTIDEVALYPTALSADRVASHYSLGRTGKATNIKPSASFSSAVRKATVTVDGSASADPDGTVASYAWSFGDGTTGSGVTASHTYAAGGTYTVTLTVTDDAGATATTTSTVTATPNKAPTAAFSTAVTDRTVGLDASASADPDGTVASYAWNFGDGATGSGATTSHTYTTDGTFPVTLTVTDDDGATTTVSQSVSVAAPVIVAADAFNRTVASGLGSADTGGAWTTANGSTRQSVAPGAATLRLDAAGNLTGSYLGAVSQTSADVLTTFSLSAAPTGSGASVYVTGRRVGTNLEYRARLRFLANGTVGLAFTKLAGSSSEVLIGGEVIVPGLSYSPGAPLNVRVQVSGTGTTQLAATVWPAGSAQPGTATVTRTDTEATLQAAGGLGLSAYLSGSATAPLAVRFTTLSVTPVR